jgi:hypothetical protein
VSLYRLTGTTPLVAPVLVAAFDGWIDASGAATAGAGYLAGDGAVVATFEDDLLFDHRSRRPVLDIVDGTLRELMWPEISVRATRLGDRDVLVLTGAEPDFRWRQLGGDIRKLSVELGVVQWISLGAIPAAVTHTRRVPVLATSSAPGLLHDDVNQGPQGLLRVPAAALSAIELAVTEAGVPAVGFYAQVPHYVAGPYVAATVALLERVGSHLGADVDLESLHQEAREQRERLDSLVESQPEAKAYLERLEELPADEGIPSGDQIASEIERFLRETGGGEANPFEER